MSGQFAQVLELVPEEGGSSGEGRGLHFRWRLSVVTGIPRQQWDFGGKSARSDGGDAAS